MSISKEGDSFLAPDYRQGSDVTQHQGHVWESNPALSMQSTNLIKQPRSVNLDGVLALVSFERLFCWSLLLTLGIANIAYTT